MPRILSRREHVADDLRFDFSMPVPDADRNGIASTVVVQHREQTRVVIDVATSEPDLVVELEVIRGPVVLQGPWLSQRDRGTLASGYASIYKAALAAAADMGLEGLGAENRAFDAVCAWIDDLIEHTPGEDRAQLLAVRDGVRGRRHQEYSNRLLEEAIAKAGPRGLVKPVIVPVRLPLVVRCRFAPGCAPEEPRRVTVWLRTLLSRDV